MYLELLEEAVLGDEEEIAGEGPGSDEHLFGLVGKGTAGQVQRRVVVRPIVVQRDHSLTRCEWLVAVCRVCRVVSCRVVSCVSCHTGKRLKS